MEYGAKNLYESELYKNIDSLIDKDILNDKQIYFYGITTAHDYAIKYLRGKGFKVAGIIDKAADERGASVTTEVEVLATSALTKFNVDKSIFLLGGNHNDVMCFNLTKHGFEEGKNIFRIFEPSSYLIKSKDKELTIEEETEVALGCLDYLDKVTRNLNIDYFLAFGSLIGAVRHKGCIPWDNDIDILVKASDLMAIYDYIENDESNNTFKMMIPGVGNRLPCMTASLIDTRTYRQNIDFPLCVTEGLGIDVSILVELGDDEEEARKNRDYDLKLQNDYKESIIQDTASVTVDMIMEQATLRNTHHKYIGCMWGNTYKSIYRADWFGDTKLVEFEGRLYKAPIGTHEYLSLLYGDYMKLPPTEEQNHNNHVWKNYWIS